MSTRWSCSKEWVNVAVWLGERGDWIESRISETREGVIREETDLVHCEPRHWRSCILARVSWRGEIIHLWRRVGFQYLCVWLLVRSAMYFVIISYLYIYMECASIPACAPVSGSLSSFVRSRKVYIVLVLNELQTRCQQLPILDKLDTQ